MSSAATRSPLVETGTPEESAAAGKAARNRVPRVEPRGMEAGSAPARSGQAARGAGQSRVPELVPIRYGRMLVSPFTFYRGAAAVMAADLADDPATRACAPAVRRRPPLELRGLRRPSGGWSSTSTTSTRRFPGPGSGTSSDWRRASRSPGATTASRRSSARRGRPPRSAPTARRCASSPRCATSTSGTRASTSSSVARRPSAKVATASRRRRASKAWPRPRTQEQPAGLRQAHRGGRRRAAHRRRPAAGRAGRGAARRPRHADELEARIRELLGRYRETPPARPAPAVRRVPVRRHGPQGGRRRQRRHPRLDRAAARAATSSDPLFLQVKEAEASVLEPLRRRRASTGNHGERVVAGQRLMQAASDIFLGWLTRDRASTASSATSTSASCGTGRARPTSRTMPPSGLALYGQLCGWTLARAHARSGDRIAIAAYLGDGDDVRPGDRRVRRALRRPERARLRQARGRGQVGPHQGGDRPRLAPAARRSADEPFRPPRSRSPRRPMSSCPAWSSVRSPASTTSSFSPGVRTNIARPFAPRRARGPPPSPPPAR